MASTLYQEIILKPWGQIFRKCTEGMSENSDFPVVKRAAWFEGFFHSWVWYGFIKLLCWSLSMFGFSGPLQTKQIEGTQLSKVHLTKTSKKIATEHTTCEKLVAKMPVLSRNLPPSPTLPVRSSKRMAPRLHQSQASVSSRIAPTSEDKTFQLILKRSVTPSKLTYIYKVTVKCWQNIY